MQARTPDRVAVLRLFAVPVWIFLVGEDRSDVEEKQPHDWAW